MNEYEYAGDKISQEQKQLLEEFTEDFKRLSYKIKKLKQTRNISLALTNLEQSSMWLKKGITHD